MANVIKHKRGSGSDPSASNLVIGELAIRTDNGKLFTKMDSGSIAEIAGGGSDIAINTLSSSSATGGGSATFNGSAYRFTLSSPPSVSAAQLLVSVNGVIQKPVAGTGQPSEGFSVDGSDIIFGDAPATGADFFILTFRSLGVSEPAANSVTNAKVASNAAIAGTKISPDFGSQNIVTTGTLSLATVAGTNTNASLNILFQTSAGVIDGGSGLTYNPAGDSLSVNGNFINTNTFRGSGALGRLTCANHSSSTFIDVSDTIDISTVDNATDAFTVKQGSNEYITVDTNNSSELITLGNTTTNPKTAILGGNVGIGTSIPGKKLDVTGDFHVSAQILNERGTASAPPFSFTDDTDTGMFNILNADLGFSVGGIERMRIDSSGTAIFSQNILLEGGSNHAYPHIRLHSSAANVRKWTIYNGQGWNPDALLIYDTDADSTALTIETNKLGVNKGASSLTETLEVGGNASITGNLIIETSGKGISFAATSDASGATSELLDDYEEGTWTPTAFYGSGSFSAVNNAVCRYVKVGSLVQVSGRFSLTGGGSGELIINGLPFAKGNPSGDGNSAGIQIYVEGAASNISNGIVGLVLDASTEIFIRRNGTTASGNDMAGKVDGGTTLLIGGTYNTVS